MSAGQPRHGLDLPRLPIHLGERPSNSEQVREVRPLQVCGRALYRSVGIKLSCSLMLGHSGACRSWVEY